MKFRPLTSALALAIMALSLLGCNLLNLISPKTDLQSTSVEPTLPLPSRHTVAASPSAAPTATIAVISPVPTKSKLPRGEYWCLPCNISDEYLADFKVLGGVPPLEWVSPSLNLTFDSKGTVMKAGAWLHIGTNSDAGEVCTRGGYVFEGKTATGTYNEATNTLEVVMQGEETYEALVGGSKCQGYPLVDQTTKTLTFALDEKGGLVLCKPGETGAACLANPMLVMPMH